jgi:hypothetical protein
MKTLNVVLTDEEHAALLALKGDKTSWHDFLTSLIVNEKVTEVDKQSE